jgi:hypothetical protein
VSPQRDLLRGTHRTVAWRARLRARLQDRQGHSPQGGGRASCNARRSNALPLFPTARDRVLVFFLCERGIEYYFICPSVAFWILLRVLSVHPSYYVGGVFVLLGTVYTWVYARKRAPSSWRTRTTKQSVVRLFFVRTHHQTVVTLECPGPYLPAQRPASVLIPACNPA